RVFVGLIERGIHSHWKLVEESTEIEQKPLSSASHVLSGTNLVEWWSRIRVACAVGGAIGISGDRGVGGDADEKADIELDGGKWRLEFLTSRMHHCNALHEVCKGQRKDGIACTAGIDKYEWSPGARDTNIGLTHCYSIGSPDP
ncbi:hypothetical protein C5167_011303, partial [Papaver somniferum]